MIRFSARSWERKRLSATCSHEREVPRIFRLLLQQEGKAASPGVIVIAEKSLDHRNVKAVAFVKQLVRFRFSPNAQGIQIFFGIEILHSMLRGKGQHFFLLSLLYPG